MIKPVLKTLSLSFVVLCAAVASPSEGSQMLRVRSLSSDSVRGAKASPTEVEHGWARQQRKLDALLAARVAEGVAVPGAIILPPFPSFAPYRTDVPSNVQAKKTWKPSTRATDSSTGVVGH